MLDHWEMKVVVQSKDQKECTIRNEKVFVRNKARDSTLMSDNTGVIDSSTVSSAVDPASMETTISFETITDVEDVIDLDSDVDNNNGYRLINMEMLANLFSPLTCPNCHESDCLQMEEDADKKKGLGTFISIKCCYCDYQNDTYTSKSVALMEKSKGMKTFDVNIRTVYAMRSIGVGYAGLEKYVDCWTCQNR